MSGILESNRMHQLMAGLSVPPEDQTRSPFSSEYWSDAGLQFHRQIGHADLRVILVYGTGDQTNSPFSFEGCRNAGLRDPWPVGTGAMCIFGDVPRHPLATSPRSSLCYQDFGTYVENGYLSLLLEDVLRLVQPQNTKAAVSTIKFNFSLNFSQLADILGVARPTIYSWLDEEAEVRIQPDNERRIQQLAPYAELWWAKAGRQLPKELLDSSLGSLLLDLLKAEIHNDQLIRRVIEALGSGLPPKRQFLKVEGAGPVPEGEPLTLDEFMD